MALSADRTLRYADGAEFYRRFLMTASQTIYVGSLVSVDSSGTAIPASDTASTKFVGVSTEQVTSAASGASYVRCRTGWDVLLPATSITQAMVGDWMYVVDDETVDDAAGTTNDIPVGKLMQFVSTTSGWVNISSSQAAATAGTAVSYATGASVVHLSALASVTVSAAIDELYENIDDEFCNDGDGTTSASPGTNRNGFAKAINAQGAGVSIRVRGDGAGTTATYLLSCSADYATDGIPIVSDADPTNVTRQPSLYGPSAIGASTNGWAYQYYRQLNSGINTTTSTTGDPIFCGAAGIPAIAKPGAAGGSVWVCGQILSSAADGEILFMLPAQPSPQYTEAHTVTAGEAAAGLVDIDTGWGVNPATVNYFIVSAAGVVVSGKDEVVTIGTGGAGTVRIADGGATYATTATDIIYFNCSLY